MWKWLESGQKVRVSKLTGTVIPKSEPEKKPTAGAYFLSLFFFVFFFPKETWEVD
jgi:hypothetical protein